MPGERRDRRTRPARDPQGRPAGELPALLAAARAPRAPARGDHLARYQRAERRGLIGREDLAAVVARLEVIAEHVIIRDGAR